MSFLVEKNDQSRDRQQGDVIGKAEGSRAAGFPNRHHSNSGPLAGRPAAGFPIRNHCNSGPQTGFVFQFPMLVASVFQFSAVHVIRSKNSNCKTLCLQLCLCICPLSLLVSAYVSFPSLSLSLLLLVFAGSGVGYGCDCASLYACLLGDQAVVGFVVVRDPHASKTRVPKLFFYM